MISLLLRNYQLRGEGDELGRVVTTLLSSSGSYQNPTRHNFSRYHRKAAGIPCLLRPRWKRCRRQRSPVSAAAELPDFAGPAACLHLLSLISLVDHDLAVIYPPLFAVPFWKVLRNRGFRLVEAHEEEFSTQGPNVLALAPGKCLMLEGNPLTRRRLEEAGCGVLTYEGKEISLKAEGGPTYPTRPVWRAPV